MLRELLGSVTVLAVSLAFMGLSACTSDPGGDGVSGDSTPASVRADAERVPSSMTSVLVIGDSITAQGRDVIFDVLGSRYDVSVDGRSGFRTDQQVATARRLAKRDFDQVIIELGTNDVFQGIAPESSGAALSEIIGSFDSARCVHLVDVDESMSSLDPDLPGRAQRINAVIRGIADDDPRIGVISWSAIVRDYDESANGEPVTVDGVHPGRAGQRLLVDAYLAALDGCGP